MTDDAYHRYCNGRLLSMRNNRYSWWAHWRELADYFLPRRYKWLITPNQWNRGSPINGHIIDSTGVVAARNLASGLLSGKSSPTRNWFKLKIGRLDSTQTTPVSLWLAECERLLKLVLYESGFYNSAAVLYYDLVVFGTAVLLSYEDYDNVVRWYNPCAGEYYIALDGQYRPRILGREFTKTVGETVDEFGIENCPESIQALYRQEDGSGRSRELIIGHLIEPNDDGRDFGVSKEFQFREAYWVWGGTNSPQGAAERTFLRKRGYYEQPFAAVRWDLVSNDPYGRSPAMDALGDQKQLQLESRRKAQAIDKMTNPPLVADIQLKNQPASLLPGGMTYVAGFASSGKPGIASVYDTKFPVAEITADLVEVRERLKRTLYNDLFQTASQFETRSNITAVEWDMRKSESMIMLGPAIERVDHEGLSVVIERVFAMMSRAGILPPPPPEIAGQNMDIEFISMLAQAQSAAEAAGIERLMQVTGNLVGVDPGVMDNIDIDFAVDKYSSLLGNDPRMIRSPEQLAEIRQNRAQAQAQIQQAEVAQKLAAGAKTLSETQVGGGANALQAITGGA